MKLDSCDGKKRFETHKLATRVLNRNKKTERTRMIYRCHVCEGYHLGTNLGGKRARLEAIKAAILEAAASYGLDRLKADHPDLSSRLEML